MTLTMPCRAWICGRNTGLKTLWQLCIRKAISGCRKRKDRLEIRKRICRKDIITASYLIKSKVVWKEANIWIIRCWLKYLFILKKLMEC